MNDALLLRERRGSVLLLTINRPDKRNALNEPLRQCLIRALDEAAADAEVRAVVLTGAGDQAFAAGADITEFAGRTPVELHERLTVRRVFDAIEGLPKPVIAAINGVCLGGGLELALACDIRIASATAKLGQPEVKLGLIPGGGATQRLPRLVGEGTALRMILTGEPVTADEARRLGLVSEVMPGPALVDRSVSLGEALARNSPVALAAAKQAVRAALGLPMAEGLRLEASLFATCFASEDRAEGIAAFLEKRPPNFSGR